MSSPRTLCDISLNSIFNQRCCVPPRFPVEPLRIPKNSAGVKASIKLSCPDSLPTCFTPRNTQLPDFHRENPIIAGLFRARKGTNPSTRTRRIQPMKKVPATRRDSPLSAHRSSTFLIVPAPYNSMRPEGIEPST